MLIAIHSFIVNITFYGFIAILLLYDSDILQKI